MSGTSSNEEHTGDVRASDVYDPDEYMRVVARQDRAGRDAAITVRAILEQPRGKHTWGVVEEVLAKWTAADEEFKRLGQEAIDRGRPLLATQEGGA